VLFVDSIPLRLADRYPLEEQIGSGRMAAVWRAWDEVLGRPVAVKVVSAWLLRDSMMHARLITVSSDKVGTGNVGDVLAALADPMRRRILRSGSSSI
jgi:serine/threonine protein kinase